MASGRWRGVMPLELWASLNSMVRKTTKHRMIFLNDDPVRKVAFCGNSQFIKLPGPSWSALRGMMMPPLCDTSLLPTLGVDPWWSTPATQAPVGVTRVSMVKPSST